MSGRPLSSSGRKKAERDIKKGKRTVSLEDIAAEKEYAKQLSAFTKWLYYSKDMGSYEKRREYYRSKKGYRELQKRFGDAFNKMPKDWDESKFDYEQQAIMRTQSFLEALFDFLGFYDPNLWK